MEKYRYSGPTLPRVTLGDDIHFLVVSQPRVHMQHSVSCTSSLPFSFTKCVVSPVTCGEILDLEGSLFHVLTGCLCLVCVNLTSAKRSPNTGLFDSMHN